MPVTPDTREAESGELLEPERWRLQWAEITPLDYSLGDRVRLHLKMKQNKKLLNSTIRTQTKQLNWKMGQIREVIETLEFSMKMETEIGLVPPQTQECLEPEAGESQGKVFS